MVIKQKKRLIQRLDSITQFYYLTRCMQSGSVVVDCSCLQWLLLIEINIFKCRCKYITISEIVSEN